MAKHNVSELEGALLDAAVAKAEGRETATRADGLVARFLEDGPAAWYPWKPSRVWMQGGPIIERERIAIAWFLTEWRASHWRDPIRYQGHIMTAGSTPLIAAMRAYVTSKFGEEVELP